MDFQKNLHFPCRSCKKQLVFSVLEIEATGSTLTCPNCKHCYRFNDKNFSRQLKKFVKLITQINESQEILSHTHVGVDVGEYHIEIPYKLLLTRLNSTVELQFEEEPLKIEFRTECLCPPQPLA